MKHREQEEEPLEEEPAGEGAESPIPDRLIVRSSEVWVHSTWS